MTRDIWEETAPNAGSPPFVGATGGATDPRDGPVYFAGGYRLSADDLAEELAAVDSGKTELGMFSGGARRKVRRSHRTRLTKKQRHQKKRQQTRRRPSRR